MQPEFGILFDMDGVLVDIHEYNWKSNVQAIQQEYGLNIEDEGVRIQDNIGVDLEKIVDSWNERFKEKLSEQIDFYHFRKTANDLVYKLMDGKGELPKLEANEKVTDLLDIIKKNNIPYSIGTSSSKKRAIKILRKIGYYCFIPKWNYFSRSNLVVLEDVNEPKPEKEVYVKAAKKINMKPENCVVIEDSIPGIKAGVKAGAKVIAIRTSYQGKDGKEKFFSDKELYEAGASDVIDIKELTYKKIAEVYRNKS